MEDFPPEVLLIVFAFLDQNSLLSATLVSKAWLNLLSPVIWRDVTLLPRRNRRHAYTNKAFWAGVRRNGSSVRTLRVEAIQALDAFLQEEEEEEEQRKTEEEKEVLLTRPRRPYVSHLVDLNINFSRLRLEILTSSRLERNLALFKNLPPRLLMMLRNNPGLETLSSNMWPITNELYYKRRLLNPVAEHGKKQQPEKK